MNQELTANTTLSHYRIVAPLGAGGMGEVWLAEDTRLDRQVALKLLPAAFTQDAERVRRFIQEAKAASGLNHPNIITVFDIGECAAGRFIVMELVAGRTLRSVIAADNSLDTFLSLSQQMAKALSAAHSAGITHRDIKPDNIMVRDDGYVKVLDFGLARLNPTRSAERGTRKEEAETLVQQTTPGTVMGTVAYMSPEQARGEIVSHPSDIFALGIVLYELATGRHPFQAETLVGYLHAITLQEPLPLTQWKPELPAALNDLIQRMLAKDARQRPTASEVAQVLQDIERHGDTVKQRSGDDETMMLPAAAVSAPRADEGFWVAVLPFKWRGANAELEALAEGLSEDIVTGLSRFSYLRVIARGSTLRYTNNSSDVRAIGRELGARYVMEGSLRQAGALLRVAVQLVDASTGAHLWAETYDRQFRAEDIFALQDDLVPRIVSTVADQYGALVHSMSESLRGRSVGQYSAHEAVLRAFGYFERVTAEEHAEVREILEAAVASAPSHSDCQAILSVIYWHEYANGYNVRPDSLSRAHAAARQAVAAAPTNHLAHFTLAAVLFLQKDFLAFRAAAERALALNRMDASTTGFLGNLIAYSGDWEYGLGVTERAMQLNPNHPGWFHFPAVTFAYHKRDYRGALESALKVNVPGYFWTHAALAAAYGQLGEREPARAALRELIGLVPNFAALAREEYGKWLDAELTEHLLDGLRKAGLEELQTTATARYSTGSGSDLVPLNAHDAEEPDRYRSPYRTEASASIVVLPFANISADEENFCGGLAEERSSSVSSRLRHTVGREPERNELRVAFKAANDGRGSLVCVAGEPGIGKTTLVEDFLTELAAEHHCTIARGRCSERLAGTEAYLPLLEALESRLRHSTASGSEPGSFATTMKQLAPTWYAQVVPLSGDSEDSARLLAEVKAASQERMKRELASFLTAVAEAQPLVIFFDDLHWADVSTIDLLSFLAGKFNAMRVLIVTTYRPSDMLLAKHPFMQIKPDLQARGLCRELSLEFLTEAEIADYLTLEFPRHAFPHDFAKLIHAKTEGSPLFMADLVRYLRDHGVIAQSSGSWKLEQTLPDIERELPESVRGMIERKIAQLSEEDRKLLTAASVQGYEFDSAVVAQVLQLEADEVEERLEKLERVFAFVKLVSEGEFPNRTLTLKYRFVHVLYQNALYAELRITRKASLSAAVAQSLLEFYGAQSHSIAGELAQLFETARAFAKSAEQFAIAAQQAVKVFANAEAIILSRRGLNALQPLPADNERDRQELALQLTLGLSLAATTFWAAPEVGDVHRRAQELCRQQVGDPQFFQVLTGLWSHHVIRAELREASEFAQQILQLAETAQDSFMLELAHCFSGITMHHLGILDDAGRHFAASLSLYRPGQNLPYHTLMAPSVGSASEWARNLWVQGYPDQALRQVRQAYELAASQSNPGTSGFAQVFTAFIHQLRREEAVCLENAEAVITLSREKDIADNILWASCARGWAQSRRGQTETGILQLRETTAICKAVGAEIDLTHFLAMLAESYGCAGQFDEGLATVDEALAMTARNLDCYYDAELHRLRGELLLLKGATEAGVETCFQQAISIAQQQNAKSWELRTTTSLARLWQRQGKIAEARQMLAEIYGWFTEGFDTADLRDAKALLEELQP